MIKKCKLFFKHFLLFLLFIVECTVIVFKVLSKFRSIFNREIFMNNFQNISHELFLLLFIEIFAYDSHAIVFERFFEQRSFFRMKSW